MATENQLTTPKTFQERIADRIRESIGDLITDEDLVEMVKQGINDVFFKPGRTPSSPYGHKDTPPLIHEVVMEVLAERMDKAVAAWLQSHDDEVKGAVAKCVQDGAGAAMMRGMAQFFANQMTQFEYSIQNKLMGGH